VCSERPAGDGVAPLALVVAAFLVYSVPPYLSLDPAQARVPTPPGCAAHYWFLVAHILFGTIAIVGVIRQIWPWLRRTHPALHRRIGRVYIFGGAITSALMALSIALSSPFGPAAGVLNVVAALLWLGFTIAGFRATRQRRYADHRKSMIRSFAMTMNILLSGVYAPAFLSIGPHYADMAALMPAAATLSGTLSLFTLLLLSPWWLDRKPASAR
jgi:CDP-diglyceride synthetase